ncbi:hypothetical protein PC129_g915 [Phytophthora cactorum]|uniref:Uncharacterized protein n=1 Tax=Phytophthora cactorum TaxID=29920 RepID=A0A8T1IU29_9STRA|nr:hypothetical protein Pcac1_g2403 [Phytophthora cactorum]KAG3041166.1 hypothetical protein PC119_g876 [Phytophthora cactorum]KAG3228574.1 hypothetical protein PC129_g915 [Phytophthora cactorum]KAG4251614.1 hypothetical protein PC116_g696 [Phytophthora cactorum]
MPNLFLGWVRPCWAALAFAARASVASASLAAVSASQIDESLSPKNASYYLVRCACSRDFSEGHIVATSACKARSYFSRDAGWEQSELKIVGRG